MIEVEIEAEAWLGSLPEAHAIALRAAEATLVEGPAQPPEGPGSVVILLTDDSAVEALNIRFRHKAGPTNVLSFPAAPNPARHLGDIALAYGVCAREAEAQGKPLADHLSHLVAHGVLHLLGYDHETEAGAEAMESLERAILAWLGVPDPYAARAIP